MKKVTLLFLVAFSVFAVASCGKSVNEMNDNTKTATVIRSELDGGRINSSFTEKFSDAEEIYFTNGKYSVEGDVVLNCNVRLNGGTYFEIGEGSSLQINGNVEASKRNIFSGEGDLRLNMPDSFGYVDWVYYMAKTKPTDNTSLLQTAFDSMNRLYLTDEGYKAGRINVEKPLSVIGIGTHRIPITVLGGTESFINISSSDVYFENLNINMLSAGDNCTCFSISSEKETENISLKDIFVQGAFAAIRDDMSSAKIKGLTLSGVTMQTARDTQIILKNTDNIKLVEVDIIRRHDATISCNMAGAIIENADGVVLEHFDVNGDWADCGTDGHGIIMRNCNGCVMRRCLMEYICGSGFIFENCSNFDLENVQTYTFTNNGFYIDGLKDSVLRVVKVTNGDSGVGSGMSEFENYLIKNCENVVFDSVISNFATAEGFKISDSKNVTVNSLLISDVRNNYEAYAFYDGGKNKNVVVNGFVDRLSSGKRKDKGCFLTGNGVVINSALLAGNGYSESLTK